MARVSVTTQTAVGYKLAPALTAPTVDGDVIDVGKVRLWVMNGSGGSINVTVQTPATVRGLDVSELVVAVAAGQTALLGPFPKDVFGRTSGADQGRAYVDYSAVASVTRAVVAL
jgi:hypothetical protein